MAQPRSNPNQPNAVAGSQAVPRAVRGEAQPRPPYQYPYRGYYYPSHPYYPYYPYYGYGYYPYYRYPYYGYGYPYYPSFGIGFGYNYGYYDPFWFSFGFSYSSGPGYWGYPYGKGYAYPYGAYPYTQGHVHVEGGGSSKDDQVYSEPSDRYSEPSDRHDEREREMGSIRLRANPREAKVYVDGALVGTVDEFDGLIHHLELAPGTHQLELRATGYESYSTDISVAAGKVRTERANLRRVGN
jgi:hypothetical protein